jgi:hypothetical protein
MLSGIDSFDILLCFIGTNIRVFFNNPKKALKDNISLINLLYKNLLSNMLNN